MARTGLAAMLRGGPAGSRRIGEEGESISAASAKIRPKSVVGPFAVRQKRACYFFRSSRTTTVGSSTWKVKDSRKKSATFSVSWEE